MQHRVLKLHSSHSGANTRAPPGDVGAGIRDVGGEVDPYGGTETQEHHRGS